MTLEETFRVLVRKDLVLFLILNLPGTVKLYLVMSKVESSTHVSFDEF